MKKVILWFIIVITALAGLVFAARDYIKFAQDYNLLVNSALPPRLILGLVGLEIILGTTIVLIVWIIWASLAMHPSVVEHSGSTFPSTFNGKLYQAITNLRSRSGWLRYIAAAQVLLLPMWVLQHVLASGALGFSARFILTLAIGLFFAVTITRDHTQLIRTSSLIVSWIIIASVFALSQAFLPVKSYPFSLGWSEGNRFWDYSVLFGHRFYNYPADKSIFAYIDWGRQALWGLPFLFARIPIWGMRLWNSLVSTLPYAILGWLVFSRWPSPNNHRSPSQNKLATGVWFLAGLWTFLFLNQGPIYTPLILSAWLVAIAWRIARPRPGRSSLWLLLVLPLVAIAGYYAQIARFTWMFAPAIWAGMLFFADLPPGPSLPEVGQRRPDGAKVPLRRAFFIAFAAFLAGLLGGYIYPNWGKLQHMVANWITGPEPGAEALAGTSASTGFDAATPAGLSSIISRQPLLWDRLLPNQTYSPGILLALIIATVPLILFLIYLIRTRRWPLDILRGLAILLPLAAFLGVGLIASVKIGGGGDLHNMDMFLVTLVFSSALAWSAGGYKTIFQIDQQPVWVRVVWLLMTFIFAFQALREATPIRVPSPSKTKEALAYTQERVNEATGQGEILFLDQRQLLTFGDVPPIPLVVDYEKKYLMDQALSEDAAYFASFHKDLQNQRFALIISEPLKIVYRGEAYNFGDENDAWVKWVARPILCYYEPLKTFKEVKVQLLVPRANPEPCTP